jgi:hypothetical protein
MADMGQVSDGYHTFHDLYAHRIALFLALCRAVGMGWKSRVHADGSAFDGWFIAGVTLPMVGEITYHLPNEAWDEAAHLQTVAFAPPWDGHTPEDVVQRLTLYATLLDEEV